MAEYNASDTRHIRAAQKQAKALAAQEAGVLLSLMSSLAGRAWIYSLLSACHVFATSFNREALLMAFTEGERSIGLRIFVSIVNACPDQYLAMMREAQENEDGRRNTSPDSGPTGDLPDPGRDDSPGAGTVESEYDPSPED